MREKNQDSGLTIRVSAGRFRPYPFKQDNNLGRQKGRVRKSVVGLVKPLRSSAPVSA